MFHTYSFGGKICQLFNEVIFLSNMPFIGNVFAILLLRLMSCFFRQGDTLDVKLFNLELAEVN